MILFLLMQISDYKDVVSTNDATVQGILIGIVLALGAVVVFLYRKTDAMNKEYVKELKEFNAAIMRVNNSYNEFVSNFVKYQNDVRERK